MKSSRQVVHFAVSALLPALLMGCASVSDGPSSGVGKVFEGLAETFGLRKPDPPAALTQIPESARNTDVLKEAPRFVTLRLHASPSLNTNEQDRSLSLVVRVYKLKGSSAFLSASHEAFLNPEKEKEALREDLVEVRDVLLMPGQRYEAQERMPRDANFVGVVGLFRTPAVQRWRYAFATDPSTKTGLTLGAHACALSVGVGEPLNVGTTLHSSPMLLNQVRCPNAR